jgi:signal transduction histidine kinase
MDQSTSRLVAGVIRLRRQRRLALAVTLAIFVIALVLRAAAASIVPAPFPFLVFFPAIGLATFFGGIRMGVLFAILAVVLGAYFVTQPGAPANFLGLAYFGAIALSICYVIGVFNQALEQNLALIVELRAAIGRAEAATASKTRMMARIGHDLKLPLQTIVGTLELLSSRRADPADHAHIDRAHRAVAQQLQALDNLMEAARLELGQRAAVPKPFAIGDALTALAEDCAPLAARKGLRDNGVGIASETLSRIFDEFYQETQESEGVGLGLAIVKETSTLLNCRIEADSQPGRGTRFSIFVPWVAAASEVETV